MRCFKALLILLVMCFSGNGQSAIPEEKKAHELHHRMTTGEIRNFFGVSSHSEVPDYDVVVPFQANPNGLFLSENLDLHARRKRNTEVPSRWFYTVEAFGRSLHLNLTRESDFLSPLLKVETRHKDGSITHSKLPDVAFLAGHVTSHPGSRVAVSNDNGLTGMIHLNGETLLLQPLPAHLAEHDGAREQAVPHVIFRRSAERFPAQCQLKERIQRRAVEHDEPVYSDGSPTDKFLVMRLVADNYFVEFYQNQDQATKNLLMIAHLVNGIFHDTSIGERKITPTLGKLVLLESAFDYRPNSPNRAKLGIFETWAKQNNPEEKSQFHADVMNLISRGGSGGLASLGTTCKHKFGASVSNDIGLQTALIVAHEIAHTLGVGHDGAAECPNSKNVMATSVPGGVGAAEWSPCSRDQIQEFLREERNFENPTRATQDDRETISRLSERSSCLDDVPRTFVKEPKEFHQIKPGRLFDADMQCKSAYNEDYYHCPQTKSNCGSLYCTDTPGECFSKVAPPLDGTKCGDRHWCIKGACVDDGSPIINGGWSSWSRTHTPCTLTCGGEGIQWRTRTCTKPPPQSGGQTCEGSDTGFMRLCNTRPCPEGSKSFRDLQCAKKWNSKAIATYNVQDPCALNCRSGSWTSKKGTAVDGSRCHRDPHKKDICLGGKCVSVGCDNVFGSGIQFDRCGVCGGDSTQCKQIYGYFDYDWRKFGPSNAYSMVTVPEGARQIAVQEKAHDENLIGVKDMEGNFLLNVYRNGGRVDKLGTTITWVRPKGKPEWIYIPGPINQPINLMFIYVERGGNKNQGVRYRFLIPGKSEIQPKNVMWAIGSWSACSEQCAGGVQQRSVACVRKDDKTFVKEQLCGKKSIAERQCNKGACPAEWFISGWRPCSRTCGKGVQNREIVCRRKVTQERHQTLPRSRCGNKPSHPNKQWCNQADCPPEWVPSKWSKCSTTCGRGVVTRALTCKRLNSEGKYTPVPAQLCVYAIRPPKTEACNEDVLCPGYRPVGCFDSRDSSSLEIIHNFRGGNINWDDIQQTVKACADRVRKEYPELKVFGLEFFGECKAGRDAESTYKALKGSKECTSAVGKQNTIFIYEFIGP